RVGGAGAGAAGPLPLGLGRQAVGLAGLLGQPAAVGHGGVVGHAQGGLPLVAQAEGRVGVGGRRPGDDVGGLVLLGPAAVLGGLLLPPGVVLVPGDLALAHPERPDRDGVLGALVVAAALLVLGAAHQEGAAGDGHHVELDLGAGDQLAVALVCERVHL